MGKFGSPPCRTDIYSVPSSFDSYSYSLPLIFYLYISPPLPLVFFLLAVGWKFSLPFIVSSFREHHLAPTAMCDHDVFEANGDTVMLTVPVMLYLSFRVRHHCLIVSLLYYILIFFFFFLFLRVCFCV